MLETTQPFVDDHVLVENGVFENLDAESEEGIRTLVSQLRPTTANCGVNSRQLCSPGDDEAGRFAKGKKTKRERGVGIKENSR